MQLSQRDIEYIEARFAAGHSVKLADGTQISTMAELDAYRGPHSDEPKPLADLKVDELRALAIEKGVEGDPTKLTKAKLIEAIEAAIAKAAEAEAAALAAATAGQTDQGGGGQD